MNAGRNRQVTFCIVTFNRTESLKSCLSSINKHGPEGYCVKLLVMGEHDSELDDFLVTQQKDRIEVIRSTVILGIGGGRKLLVSSVTSPFTMTLDDDISLIDGSVASALKVLAEDSQLGAMSMPLYDAQGRMMSLGGRNLAIRNGIIYRRQPKFDPQAHFIEVEDLSGGAMLFKTEMRECFSWDHRYRGAFDDLDKSLQIMKSGKWKQAILPKGRLLHDRSWLGRNPKYERRRFDGLAARGSYRLFREKWGLRLDLESHFLYQVAFPTLTLTKLDWAISLIHRFFRVRNIRAMREMALRVN